VQIHVSNSPRHLALTQTMVEDFLFDPVLACSVIWPDMEFDAYQKVAMKIDWWVPNVMDSSGINSGKSIRRFFYMNLRAMLLPNFASGHVATVYFPTFGSTKKNFWKYYKERFVRSPIFNAQIGEVDVAEGDRKAGKGLTSQPDCLFCKFRNGSQVEGPTPDIGRDSAGQKSARQHTQLFDEYVTFDAAGTVIDDELIKRATGENFNPFHPLWSNHSKFSAHAETGAHPSARRFRRFASEIRRGNPNYAHLSFSYKDYSALPRRDGRTFLNLRHSAENAMQLSAGGQSTAQHLGTDLGIWSDDGDEYYTQEMVGRAQELGRRMGLEPVLTARELEHIKLAA
jgi:hypothetical protein